MSETIIGFLFSAKGLGAILTLLGGVFAGWFASRANIMGAVNRRVESLLEHLELEIARVSKAHSDCEERVVKLARRIEDVEGELRHAKQTLQSIATVKND